MNIIPTLAKMVCIKQIANQAVMLPVKNALVAHMAHSVAFCGPACVQMVLGCFGVEAKNHPQDKLIDQTKWNEDPALDGEYYSYPDGIANTLMEKLGGVEFEECADFSKDEALKRIDAALARHACPVLALVKGGSHWVAVTKSANGAYTVYDPSPNAPPPPDAQVSFLDDFDKVENRGTLPYKQAFYYGKYVIVAMK